MLQAGSHPRPRRGPTTDRRHFLQLALAGGLGLSLDGLPALGQSLGYAPRSGSVPAERVIQIFLGGGLSHLDSFDPKPYAPVEIRGQLKTVKTAIDGAVFSELLSRTAKVAHHLAVIRSMTHGEAAHERGYHTMLTGYQPSPAITYPSLGSVLAHELGSRESLPPYVVIPRADQEFLGPGYLSSAYGPFSVMSEPSARDFKVRDLAPPKEVDAARLARRRRLVEAVDEGFAGEGEADALDATAAFYDQAWKLIDSKPAREAFDLQAEAAKIRDQYGRTRIGQRLLLARRLVEAGVRFVTVNDGGYDHHRDIFQALPGPLRPLDQGFAALITDLEQRGLLASTLVVLITEFGRTSRINEDRGRDHWPKVFSVALAGGGIKGGVIHGASDAEGREPDRDPVSPADLAATVFAQAGIDPSKRLLSPGDRPVDIVRGGEVIRGIVA